MWFRTELRRGRRRGRRRWMAWNETMGAFIMYRQRSIRSSLPIRNEEPISFSLSLSFSYIYTLDSLAFGLELPRVSRGVLERCTAGRLYRFVSTELINNAAIFFPVLKPWNRHFHSFHRSLGIKRAEIRQTDVFPTRSKDCMETKVGRGEEQCVGRERER